MLNIEEGTEQTEQTPDAEQWERELNVFRTIDINKPRLVPLYTSATEYDMNGIAVTTYESLEPDATVVRRIQYRMDQGELLSLEAEMSDKKPIYSNKRIDLDGNERRHEAAGKGKNRVGFQLYQNENWCHRF